MTLEDTSELNNMTDIPALGSNTTIQNTDSNSNTHVSSPAKRQLDENNDQPQSVLNKNNNPSQPELNKNDDKSDSPSDNNGTLVQNSPKNSVVVEVQHSESDTPAESNLAPESSGIVPDSNENKVTAITEDDPLEDPLPYTQSDESLIQLSENAETHEHLNKPPQKHQKSSCSHYDSAVSKKF